MPRRNLLVILLAAVIAVLCNHQVRNRYGIAFSQAIEVINQRYVEPVGRQELFDAAMNGMTSGLDDHSRYFTAGEFQQFQEVLDKEFHGIGIQVMLDPKTEQLTVVTPIMGSPALAAGMRAGDVVLSVNGEEITGLGLEDIVGKLKGPAGSYVNLEVLHAGADKPVSMRIERAEVVADSVLGDTRNSDGSWNFHLEEDPRIGYIRITTFGNHTLEEFQAALATFRDQPVAALLLDLRGNSGGRLDVAIPLCDMFIDEGVIVSTKGRNGEQNESFSASRGTTVVPRALPMAMLVDRFSASASEIFAACLQDHARAAIVGERTYGKGTVQEIVPMAYESALKLTTATYHRPSGANIDRSRAEMKDSDVWGVMPEEGLLVELSDEELVRVMNARADRDVIRIEADGHTFAPSGELPVVATAEDDDPQNENVVTAEESDFSAEETSPGDGEKGEVADDTNENEPAEEQAEPGPTDPQLQRAVDYLEEIISQPRRAAA